jgi:hypothetical protein
VGGNKRPTASGERERFWRKLVAGQPQSGVSIRQSCDQQGVSEPSYYFWRGELARRKEQHQDASSQILPVDVSPPVACQRWGLEIELPGQIVVRVNPGCNPDLSRQALTVLRDDGPEAEPC